MTGWSNQCELLQKPRIHPSSQVFELPSDQTDTVLCLLPVFPFLLHRISDGFPFPAVILPKDLVWPCLFLSRFREFSTFGHSFLPLSVCYHISLKIVNIHLLVDCSFKHNIHQQQ